MFLCYTTLEHRQSGPFIDFSLFLFSFFLFSSMPDVIIKEGYLSLKEEGLRAWIWSKRYCVLRDQSLTFHRNEVRQLESTLHSFFFFTLTPLVYRLDSVLVYYF